MHIRFVSPGNCEATFVDFRNIFSVCFQKYKSKLVGVLLPFVFRFVCRLLSMLCINALRFPSIKRIVQIKILLLFRLRNVYCLLLLTKSTLPDGRKDSFSSMCCVLPDTEILMSIEKHQRVTPQNTHAKQRESESERVALFAVFQESWGAHLDSVMGLSLDSHSQRASSIKWHEFP